ncbi:MAG: transglutaminase-like domain-containing protein, partial [Pirellulales bacterium]|nr:transglutaminase-like domain-containing protein [Pirellulales bacterium]
MPLREDPNPVPFSRWVRLGRINENRWRPLFGAKWQQRGGMITARGVGNGFGGRSLCLSKQSLPKVPYEVAVKVRLDDESGAAGLVFCSDQQDRHYGFYPSGGRIRLSCFLGPTAFSWQVLEEIDSPHYLPGQWNRLRVRVEEKGFKCFVNGHLIVESADQQLPNGQVGLAKFRGTNPDFREFRIGRSLESEKLSETAQKWLAELASNPERLDSIRPGELDELSDGGEVVSRQLLQRAGQLERQTRQLRRLAADVRIKPVLNQLRDLFATADGEDPAEDQLLRGALLVASLDDAGIDLQAYRQRVEEMAEEIRAGLDDDADETARRKRLDQYLFEENGFHGGRWEYYHPANSHLNRVID